MTDGTTVRMTYAELAAARGISIDSARRMTVRHRWPKQIGNDGLTRVDVPASALTGARTDAGADAGGDIGTDASTAAGRTREAAPIDEAAIAAIVSGVGAANDAMLSAATGDTRQAIRTLQETVPVLQEAITSLRVQLMAERDRADRAERDLRELRAQMARRPWWWRR